MAMAFYTCGPIVSNCWVYEDDSKTMQQPKLTDKASDQSRNSNEAARKNDGSNKPETSSHGIADVKVTNVEQPPQQPGPSGKSNVKKRKTRKDNVPPPPTNRSEESGTANGKKSEKKSYSSPDSRNPMEQKGEVKKVEKNPAAAGDAAVGGAPKEAGNAAPAVFKMNMNCKGCAKKIRQTISDIEGVETVKTDCESKEITVTGKMDPTKVKERLEEKMKRKVEILSPQPKKDGGDKKPEDKGKSKKKPAEEKKPEETKPKETKVVLKIRLYCDGCIHKTKKIMRKCKGVSAVSVGPDKDQVTVTGTMDVKEMVRYLKRKLNRNVEVVPPPAKKDRDGVSGHKKEKAKEKEKLKEVAPAPPPPTAASDGGEKKCECTCIYVLLLLLIFYYFRVF